MTGRRDWQAFFTKILAALFLLVGVALRARQFALGRSLWFDEATLALSIVSRSFAGLLRPLDYGQVAPLGFLFTQRTLVSLFGNSDCVLRLLPFAAGVAALFLAYGLAAECLAGTAVVFLGLLSVSEWLIYYASEAKQYSSDVLCLLLVLAAFSACLKPTACRKHFVQLGLAGTLSLWMSHPAIFSLAGTGTSLVLDRSLKKDWRAVRWLGVIACVWLLNFAAIYLVSVGTSTTNTRLLDYWRHEFMPMPPWTDVAWFKSVFTSALSNPIGLPVLGGTILIAVGYVSLLWRRWQLALCITVIVLAVLLASGLRKYPAGGRLLLFAVPVFYLLVAEGIDRLGLALAGVSGQLAVTASALLVTAVLYGPATSALRNLWHPAIGEHIKPLMSFLSERREDGDSVYVYYGAIPAFTYYTPFYAIDHTDIIFGQSSRQQPAQYLQQIDRLRSRRRVWVLFSHDCTWCTVDEEAYILAHLDRIGKRRDQRLSSGASIYLYDLSAGN